MENDSCIHEEIHYNWDIAECFDCHNVFSVLHNHGGYAEFFKVEDTPNTYECFDCHEQVTIG